MAPVPSASERSNAGLSLEAVLAESAWSNLFGWVSGWRGDHFGSCTPADGLASRVAMDKKPIWG